MNKIAVLLPWYKTTNPLTAFSLLSLVDRSRMKVCLDYGDAFIAHSRNKLASEFLRSSADWAITIDDDMVLPCGNASWFNSVTGFNLPDKSAGLNTFDRLLSHGKTLVGALYFGRWRHGKGMYGEAGSDDRWIRDAAPVNVCKPTRWVGTGCMLIHRSVFEDIEKKFPNLARDEKGTNGNWFTSSEHDLTQAVDVALAQMGDPSKAAETLREAQAKSAKNASLGMGEDVQFCIRAAQAGHQPHVDCGLLCGHQGSFIFGQRPPSWA